MYREYKIRLLKSQQSLLSREKSNLRKNGTTSRDERRTFSRRDGRRPVSRAASTLQALPKVNLGDKVEAVLQGNINVECPTTAQIVRIFTSSTFTDTRHERNALMERVYPRLKKFCQEQGYDFQVVDMRWGIREESTNDHMTTDLCMKELKACQELSTGPNFVTFLSHRYGYRPIPRVVEASEFERLLQGVPQEMHKAILQKWYKKDENSVPPAYVLLPISTHLPDYLNQRNKEAFTVAKDTWWVENGQMQEAMTLAANNVFSSDKRMVSKYDMSVTENEVTKGIIEAQSPEKSTVFFKRDIQGILQGKQSKLLTRYLDSNGTEKHIQTSREKLKELKNEKIPKVLPDDKILKYQTKWTDEGIDPTIHADHKTYIDQLCADFETSLKAMITAGIEERSKANIEDTVYQEVLQHTVFCQAKCQVFHGRKNVLQDIEEYVKGRNRSPLVIHGKSGSGKTSIMAMAAKQSWSWLDGAGVVILRFIGTTPESSNISALLYNLNMQIKKVYNREVDFDEMDDIASLDEKNLRRLTVEFSQVLEFATRTRPLVLIIDSLDQLDNEGGARQLSWLPRALPRHVKCIVSTLPEDKYECFPTLKVSLKEENFVPVPPLPDSDVQMILQKWLQLENRTLTAPQLDLVTSAFEECPLPLFLKLCFDEACRWTSFAKPEETTLEKSIRDMIDRLFAKLEKDHGKLLVSRALGYMTVSRGLTESELEDILSCDDEVLNDVYQFWTPPMRRLPPLLLVRIKSDLQQYLVDRSADGARVIYWYHRQFIEAATDRYCYDESTRRQMYSMLADYFLGKWADGRPKPYTNVNGVKDEAVRYVASQPLKFEAVYNLRKLMQLPLHLVRARELSVLKEEVLLNLEWLNTKLKASSIRQLLDDFDLARSVFDTDLNIKTVAETLQLSQSALLYDPNQLPGQLVGRISKGPDELLAKCQNAPFPCLIPERPFLTSPGGALVYALAGHTTDAMGVAISSDGRFAYTCSYDKSVKKWDVKKGQLLKSYDNGSPDADILKLCNGERYAAVGGKTVIILDLETGQVVHDMDFDSPVNFVIINHGQHIAALAEKGVIVRDVVTGKRLAYIRDIYHRRGYDQHDIIAGTDRYVAIATPDSRFLRIIDTQEKKVKNVAVFPKPKSEDDDEFMVDAMAVIDNGTRLLVSSMMSNDLIEFDMETGQKIGIKFEGNEDDCADKYHVTPDGKYLYYANNQNVYIRDLQTGKSRNVAPHSSNLFDVATVDGSTLVTVSLDYIVRIWDVSRDDGDSAKPESAENEDSKPTSYTAGLLKLFEKNPNYLLISFTEKFSGSKSNRCIGVYDLLHDKFVRKAVLHVNQGDKSYVGSVQKMFDDKYVLMSSGPRIYIVDLDNMEIKHFIKGRIGSRSDTAAVVSNNTEILCTSKGRRNLKVCSIATGETIEIIKTGQKKPIEKILVNEPKGSVAVAQVDEGPLLVVDIAKRQIIHTLTTRKKDEYLFIDDGFISKDGGLLLHEISREVPEKDLDTNTSYMIVWDLMTGKVVQHLVDAEAQKKLTAAGNNTKSVMMLCFSQLGDSSVIIGCDDGFIRVWDYRTGMLLSSTFAHQHDISKVIVSPDQKRYLSISDVDEDVAVKLWNVEDWSLLASFKAESSWPRTVLVDTGDMAVFWDEEKGNVLRLRLQGEGRKPYQQPSDVPVLFEGERINCVIDAGDPKEYSTEPDDPDTDEEEADSYPASEEEEEDDEDDEDDDDDDFDDDDDDFDSEDDKEKAQQEQAKQAVAQQREENMKRAEKMLKQIEEIEKLLKDAADKKSKEAEK